MSTNTIEHPPCMQVEEDDDGRLQFAIQVGYSGSWFSIATAMPSRSFWLVFLSIPVPTRDLPAGFPYSTHVTCDNRDHAITVATMHSVLCAKAFPVNAAVPA